MADRLMKRVMTLLASAFVAVPALAQTPHWIGAWEASPTARTSVQTVSGTLTYRANLTLSGDQVRLRFYNEGGDSPLLIDAASVAVMDRAGKLGKPHLLSFAAARSLRLPPDAGVLSDPISVDVRAGSALIVSLYVSAPTRLGRAAPIPTLYAPGADIISAPNRLKSAQTIGRPLLTAIEVRTRAPARVIVAFGDSITDSSAAISPDLRGWPERLSRRLEAAGGTRTAVVNAGIGGNRLNAGSRNLFGGISALDRFDRDVLQVPGVTHVIIAEGINDIGLSAGTEALSGEGAVQPVRPVPSAEDLIAALARLAARAHARGLKVIGATITPFEGTTGTAATPYYTPEKNAVRLQVNAWIRQSSVFDGVIDFDRALRDPARSDRMRDDLVGTDHLHPNSAGQDVMAATIDLGLFH